MLQRIIDTDHLSLWQRKHPNVIKHFNLFPPDSLSITIITVAEQMRGRLDSLNRANTLDKLVWACANLQSSLEDIKKFKIIEFDQNAASIYDDLVHRQKIRIGTQDLRIAAIALSQSAILVTRNQQDFSKVPGLILEDWSIV
jgi:tRNA(fMet)-specific endonuclease VapC